MGLPYPGGPHIDRLAKEGNPTAFRFAMPDITGFDYSFSGLKTSFLYRLRDEVAANPHFIEQNKADLCASLQKNIIDILLKKLIAASQELEIDNIAVAGGVLANSGLRQELIAQGNSRGWQVFIPKLAFTTDNAVMIAVAGYYKYIRGHLCDILRPPFA